MPRADFPALTSLRGIAAWWVVLFHIREALRPHLLSGQFAVVAKGYLAVDLFFVLSGFVIWLNNADRLGQARLRPMADFLVRRIARIYPLHLFTLLVAVGIAIAIDVTGGRQSKDFDFTTLPAHVLLVQNWGLNARLDWNVPSWSISCELAAYLLFPLLMLFIDWRRWPGWLVMAAGLGFVLTLHGLLSRAGIRVLDHQVPRFGLLRCLAEFALGTVTCALWVKLRAACWAGIGTAAAGFAVLGWGLCRGWRLWPLPERLPETLAVPPMAALLVLALALLPRGRLAVLLNPLEWRPFVYLGKISYATYLSHFLVYTVFLLTVMPDSYHLGLPLVAAYLAIVLAASVPLYHYIELPAQKAINAAWFGQGFGRSGPAGGATRRARAPAPRSGRSALR